MRNQYQHHPRDHTNRLPTPLTIFDPILTCQMQRIVKHKLGKLKADAMLDLVAGVFGVIP
jgi:hypothetical protein